MKYVLIYYTAEPKPPVIYYKSDMEEMIAEIVRMIKSNAKFAIFEVGKCVGDYS